MPTTQKQFDALRTALENNTQDLKKMLQNFDVTATNNTGSTCLMFACANSSSPEIMKLIFDKINEAGGPDLVKSQLTATNNDGRNCLTLCCRYSSSPEVVKVIIKKIEEIGGPDLFKSLVAAIDKFCWNCLMQCSCYSESPEIMKLLLEKIEKTGGRDLLKSQLAATDAKGKNCLMLCCFSNSPEVVKLIVEKIDETGGPDLLKSQLTTTDAKGQNCLMLCAQFSKSPEVVKIILEKIEETGGPDLIKSLVAATDKDDWNCLMFCGASSKFPEVVKVVLKKIEQTGGPDLLRSLLAVTNKTGKNSLMFCGYNTMSPEVMKLFAVVLFHFDLFKIQYPKLDDYDKKRLKEKAGIDSSSWAPDAASLAGVKAILQGADPHAAKKKAEEEAAAKKKAEEEAAAKKKAEEEAAAEKKIEEEAAAKKKAEEEAAAKKKAEAEAPAKEKAQEIVDAKQDQTTSETRAGRMEAKEEAALAKNTDAEAAAAATEMKKDEASPPTQQQQQQQQPSQESNAAAATSAVNAPPPSRCFSRGVAGKNLEDSTGALFSIKEAPPNRPDLANWLPEKDEASNLLHYLKCALPELKNRPAIQKLIAENGLTDDEIKILHSYKIQNPYPVYLWLNGWLGSNRRDDFVKEHVAPFFTLLYRAMEKLPRVTISASRAIKVNGIPALKNTFENYKTVCAPEQTLSFWGFSSFTTEDNVIEREEFVGKSSEEAIVYSCGKLEGVDMEPFAPKGLKCESEILPLCPCVLEVVSAVKFGKKIFVSVKHLDHTHFAYVAPKS